VIKKARELEISMGELIRMSLDRFLKEPGEVVSTSDTFFSDNVAFKDDKGVTDLSINHDQYLYEE
jgi:hypothetical protein